MANIKAEELADVDAVVYYAAAADKELLKVAAYMLAVRGKECRSLKSSLSFIAISEENKKHFKQIPNAMDIKEFFKGEHTIENNELSLKGGENLSKFLTCYKLQQALLNNPEYSILTKKDSSVHDEFIGHLVGQEDAIEFIKKISNTVRLFPVEITSSNEDYQKSLVNNFHKVLKTEGNVVDSLFATLNNMINLQDVPYAEDLEDETLKAQVSTFKSYNVKFYDKTFVDEAVQFMAKYSELFTLSTLMVAIRDSYNFTGYSSIKAKALLQEQINEFLNNLNTSKL